MMRLAVSFTNFGPYHLARLRALGERLRQEGGELIAYETAGTEQRYPWLTRKRAEPFSWITLFPDRILEDLPGSSCAEAMRRALVRDLPDAVGIVGYVRPESMAALGWAREHGRPTILMSESQAIDRPRVWWKEAVKRRRVSAFSAALVGGPRHRDYLVDLGMPADRIALGYNVVDNARFGRLSDRARRAAEGRLGLPDRPYFLAVSRFVIEKNLALLVRAFAKYRSMAEEASAWDLVLCGDGPDAGEVEATVRATGLESSIHRPGFLQEDELSRWYAFASAFVHPSLMEPWGLVVNEAAACGLPLIVSDRAGCVETLVPDPPGTTGLRFDPRDESALAAALAWVSGLPSGEREAMGRRASEVVSQWGPSRFAEGTMEALQQAVAFERSKRRTRALVR